MQKMSPTLSEQDEIQVDSDMPKSPEERSQRYEHLKKSVAALRSRVRSAPASIRFTPPSPSEVSCNSLVPYTTYFSKFPKPSPACTRRVNLNDRHQRQIEASGLLESYAMQALRLDCERKLQEGQEEMEKIRERLRDKMRRTELFDRELERQRRRLESKISFFSDQSKQLEKQLAEQAIRHRQELQLQTEAYKSSEHSNAEKGEQEISKLVSTYESSVEALRKTNDAQTDEIEKLERDYSFRLEQMERSKVKADDHMKFLDGQMRLVAKQAENIRTNYEEQEKEWNVKLQQITTIHQFQIKSLRQEYELQLGKQRKEREEAREQHNLILKSYKSQKLKDMEYVEERVKGVLEAKGATITQLKLELRHLHQQLW